MLQELSYVALPILHRATEDHKFTLAPRALELIVQRFAATLEDADCRDLIVIFGQLLVWQAHLAVNLKQHLVQRAAELANVSTRHNCAPPCVCCTAGWPRCLLRR